ncbi:substrate-binding domain-containing protein [Streptomyces sp. NPDC001880]
MIAELFGRFGNAARCRARRRDPGRDPPDKALAIATITGPRTTGVRRPIEEMGRTMARVLLKEIASENQERPQTVLPTGLAVRDSS